MFLVFCLFLASTVKPVYAANLAPSGNLYQTELPRSYHAHCQERNCTLQLQQLSNKIPSLVATGSTLLVDALLDSISILPDGNIKLDKGLALRTPIGLIELFNADFVLDLAANNTVERLHGTAQAPLPALGIFNNDASLAPVNVEFGIEPGRNLGNLPTPLEPDEQYLFFRFDVGLNQVPSTSNQENSQPVTEIATAEGQYVTLMVSLTKLFVYVDGQLSLANFTSLTLLGNILQLFARLPFRLADETGTVRLAGLVTDNLSDSFLEVQGIYTIEQSLAAQWFGSNRSTVLSSGALLINREGVLLRGNSKSNILPTYLFEGEAKIEVFLPFNMNQWNGYVKNSGSIELPVLAWHKEGKVEWNNISFQAFVDGVSNHRILAASQPLFLVVKDSTNGAVAFAARSYQKNAEVTSTGYSWTVEKVVDGATNTAAAAQFGYRSAKEFGLNNYEWVQKTASNLTETGYQSATELSQQSSAWISEQVTNTVTTVQTGVAAATESATELSQESSAWISEQVSNTVTTVQTGVEAATDLVNDSYQSVKTQATCATSYVQSGWCKWTGFCEQVEPCSDDSADETSP